MRVRFQADADLKHAIVRATLRREPAVDFQSASVGGLAGLNDLEVLAIAAREGRILVSHDKRTMPAHFAEFVVEKNTSSGVVIASQSLSVGLVVEELLLIWSASDAEEWINRIAHLPL